MPFANSLFEAYIRQHVGVLATQRAWAEVTYSIDRQTDRLL